MTSSITKCAPGVVLAFVRWNVLGDGPSDSFGEAVEVGGREGRFIEEATDRDSVMLRWAIDDPYASYLAVWAEIQGPDETELRRQVQALVESIASCHRASGTAPRSAEQHHGD